MHQIGLATTMLRFPAIKLLMPGFFLFVLGLGNLIVGHFKGLEYERVLTELAPSPRPQALLNVSPMRRMQLERETANRLDERRSKAEARRDFYRLVSFGGQSFVVLSLLFFGCGAASYYYARLRNEQEDNTIPPPSPDKEDTQPPRPSARPAA